MPQTLLLYIYKKNILLIKGVLQRSFPLIQSHVYPAVGYFQTRGMHT